MKRWRALLGGGQPPPNAALPPLRLTLNRTLTLQPLPITLGDHLDRRVATEWHQFQQRSGSGTWPAFLAHLAAANAQLAQDIAKLTASINDYAPERFYRP
jgi:hypothetical protein